MAADKKRTAEYEVELKAGNESFPKLGARFKKMTAIFSKMAGPIAIATTAIIGIFTKGLGEWKNQQRATNELSAMMVRQGLFTRKLADRYAEMADAFEMSTNFGGDLITEAQTMLQSFIGNTEITEDLMGSVLDFAAGMNVDLKTAARLVGQSVGSSTNALSRYGVVIDTAASKEEKLSDITKALNAQFGGQAAQQAKGLGALVQFENVLGMLLERFGQALEPALVFVTKQLTEATIKIQQSKRFFRILENAVDAIAAGGIIFKSVVVAVTEAVANALATSFMGMGALLKGQFEKSFQIFKDGYEETTRALVARRQEAIADIEGLVDARDSSRIEDAEGEKNKSLELLARKNLQRQKENARTQVGLAKLQRNLAKTEMSYEAQQADLLFNQFAAMENSQQKALVALGKAAALGLIAVKTIETIQNTIAFFSNIPIIGGILAAIAIVAVIIFSGQQSSNVLGVQMADGGVVSGGVVRPLPSSMGKVVDVTIEGGLNGADEEAVMLAREIHGVL